MCLLLKKSNAIKTLFPLYITNHRNRQIEIDLLYLEKTVILIIV